jgi:hypothetical protein
MFNYIKRFFIKEKKYLYFPSYSKIIEISGYLQADNSCLPLQSTGGQDFVFVFRGTNENYKMIQRLSKDYSKDNIVVGLRLFYYFSDRVFDSYKDAEKQLKRDTIKGIIE